MEHILNNEVLYKSNSLEIKKTYDKTSDRYGLHGSNGRKSEAIYLHIFPYTSDKLAPAIKDNNEYVWINLELLEEPMDKNDKWLIECSVPLNSVCNCVSGGNMFECDLCEMGSIFNSLNFKVISHNLDTTIYEYDTRDNTYRITLIKSDTISDLIFDYKWEAAELEKQIRWTIDEFEQLKGEHKDKLHVCVYKYLDENAAVQLTPYAISINLIDTSIVMNVTKNKIVLGFDEFPYSR
ncbi:hypothetical protein I0P70_03585 [Pontibacter sp. FD36]|uniref:hypothetical protein n=1 Tax=Pontibacter sp. FD36 TaxID=2789860 RepID=UPI0018ABEE80|nr:hypothetical protein [Pontibacter sp. FD36]MBF8962319.1 hypothetical protein [Pontibacter sp. FD36]